MGRAVLATRSACGPAADCARNEPLHGFYQRRISPGTTLTLAAGMTNVGYWSPEDEPLSRNTLIYIISHDSRDAAKKSWDEFRKDPEWVKVQTASEFNGKLVAKVDSIFMDATDYSPMK